jgi:hypothetical protein
MKGQRREERRVIGMLCRVGDNHQIFPEDAHRVAFADLGVNA